MITPENRFHKPHAGLIRLKPSRYLLLIVMLAHGTACLAVLFSDPGLWLQQLMIAGLVINAGVCNHRWRGTPVYRLQKLRKGWTLVNEDNSRERLAILVCHYCSRWLLIFVVKNQNGTRSYCAVLPDSCGKHEYQWFKILGRLII